MQASKCPLSFWLVVGLALLWNLFGLFSFYSHFTATPAVIASWPEALQQVAAARPRGARRRPAGEGRGGGARTRGAGPDRPRFQQKQARSAGEFVSPFAPR